MSESTATARARTPRPGDDPVVSIVIPVLNDTEELARQLADLRAKFGGIEIVVADGGSEGDVASVVAREGAALIEAEPGRGPQLNAGAMAAGGDVFWFVHADSVVDGRSVGAIERALADDEIVGGAFRFSLEARTWYKPVLDAAVAWRTNVLRQAYGDQGIFVRAATFDDLGGYPPLACMEDLVFYRRLRGAGPVSALDIPIGVNARRWETHGFVRTTARNLWSWWSWDLRGGRDIY